jgi:hypothetical protein
MKSTLEITKDFISILKEDGFFESPWIDEPKFRARLVKAMVGVQYDTYDEAVNIMSRIADQITEQIVMDNIENTLNELVDAGVIERTTSDTNEDLYKLKTNEDER